MVDLGEGADLVHKPWNHSVEMEPVVESTLRYRKHAPIVQEEMISSAGAIFSSRNSLLSRSMGRCIQDGVRADVFNMAAELLLCAWVSQCARSRLEHLARLLRRTWHRSIKFEAVIGTRSR